MRRPLVDHKAVGDFMFRRAIQNGVLAGATLELSQLDDIVDLRCVTNMREPEIIEDPEATLGHSEASSSSKAQVVGTALQGKRLAHATESNVECCASSS